MASRASLFTSARLADANRHGNVFSGLHGRFAQLFGLHQERFVRFHPRRQGFTTDDDHQRHRHRCDTVDIDVDHRRCRAVVTGSRLAIIPGES